MIKINLVAEGRRPVVAKAGKGPAFSLEGQDVGQWMLLGGLAVGAVIGVLWWFTLNKTVSKNDADIAVAQQTVNDLQEIIAEVEEFERKEQELEHKIQVITDLKNNQKGPVKIMDEISKAVPDLLWLERFRLQGNQVSLNGSALNISAVAKLIDNLDKVPEFQEPYLRDASERGQVVVFTIDFNFEAEPIRGAQPGATQAPTGG